MKLRLISSIRYLLRHKVYSIMNILGLAFGMVAVIFVSIYVNDEASFDTVHPKHDRTYRVSFGFSNDGQINYNVLAKGNWSTRLKQDLDEVETCLRVVGSSYPTSIHSPVNNIYVLSDEVRWVEPTLPEVLSLNLIAGEHNSVLDMPNGMLLSKSSAKTLFGDLDPIGQVVEIKDNMRTNGETVEMVVTGVYDDYPQNSSFRHKYLLNVLSLERFNRYGTNILDDVFFETYVVLKNRAAYDKLKTYVDSLSAEVTRKELGGSTAHIISVVKPLTDLHFDTEITWDAKGGVGSRKYLWVFSELSLLILAISCVNYINLTTARAAGRAKEISVKRVFGSSKGNLINQFLFESALLVILAFSVAFIIAFVMLPFYNTAVKKDFVFSDLFELRLIGIFCLIGSLIVGIGGSYPALFLHRFKSNELMQGKLSSGRSWDSLKKILVGFQVLVSIVLVVSSIAVIQQMNLMLFSKLNEEGDQILAIRWGDNVPYNRFPAFRNAILLDPDIKSVSLANHLPRLDHFGNIARDFMFPDIREDHLSLNQLNVDFSFAMTFDLEFVAGRDFDQTRISDSSNFIINEATVKLLGLTNAQAIDKMVENPGDGVSGKIIGVIKDFPYKSMHHSIEPLILCPRPYQSGSVVFIKLPHEKLQETSEFVFSTWRRIITDVGIESWFVGDIFKRMYEAEVTIALLVKTFSCLAVVISVFGLYGLSTYFATKRRRELGIRKVLGATSSHAYCLLLWEFVRIFLIVVVIAIPVAYLLISWWLNSYVYKVSVDFSLFAVGILPMLLILIASVSYEAIRSANINPIRIIRQE